MANQDAAFGLRPLKTVGQQDDSTGMSSYNISPGDASVIFQGALVGSPATGTGYVDLQTAGLLLNLGAFWGCFYNDPTTLKPTFKNYYPGSITPPNSGTVEAFVYDLVGTSGSTLNGVSSMELADSTLGTTGQFKIIGVSRDPENSDLTSANVNWRVMVNEHLLGSGTAGAA